MFRSHKLRLFFLKLLPALALIAAFGTAPVAAQSTAQRQAIADAVAGDAILLAFYKSRDFRPIWTGNSDKQRRKAFLDAIARADDHGLPAARYDAAETKKHFARLGSAQNRALIEVATSRKFLDYASDIQSGIVDPRRIDSNMTLKPPRRDPVKTLQAFAKSSPSGFLRTLPPSSDDYARLLKEKSRMERIVGTNAWGPDVPARKLAPGSKSAAVAALRKRLSAMGYGNLGASTAYDATLERAIKLFQQDHGLNPDGVAGTVTMAAINTDPTTRLMQVVIGLERQRWMNKPLGKRHIIVNEAAFMAYVIDNGRTTFSTRVVVGKPGRWRTPEFEDQMTHMVVNPSWFVPASIAGGEYLPLLKENADALTRQEMIMTDASGQRVDPTTVDYSKFSKDNFPYSLRQPPSDGNALGKVKFLFPNRHAIYLHDTPAKSLFGRDIRAYSHGCVRVHKPYELAEVLLSKQTSNPKGLFESALATGQEVQIDLKTPVPIYLIYQTAWVDGKGRPNYRTDAYNVDRKVFNALTKAGVVLRGTRS